MAGTVNKVILIGNLGKDPEERRFQDGQRVVNLTIATSDSWKDKLTGERKEKTEWHRVALEIEATCKVAMDYLKKGSKVYLEGKLVTRKWQDRNTGEDKYATEIRCGFTGKLVMLDGPRGTSSGPAEGDAGYSEAEYQRKRENDEQRERQEAEAMRPTSGMGDALDDDIPF